MTEMNMGNLRSVLDEVEQYASAVLPIDPGYAAAQEMLAVIKEARTSLRPSADSTANYVPTKDIIEQLMTLRAKAENLTRAKG